MFFLKNTIYPSILNLSAIIREKWINPFLIRACLGTIKINWAWLSSPASKVLLVHWRIRSRTNIERRWSSSENLRDKSVSVQKNLPKVLQKKIFQQNLYLTLDDITNTINLYVNTKINADFKNNTKWRNTFFPIYKSLDELLWMEDHLSSSILFSPKYFLVVLH